MKTNFPRQGAFNLCWNMSLTYIYEGIPWLDTTLWNSVKFSMCQCFIVQGKSRLHSTLVHGGYRLDHIRPELCYYIVPGRYRFGRKRDGCSWSHSRQRYLPRGIQQVNTTCRVSCLDCDHNQFLQMVIFLTRLSPARSSTLPETSPTPDWPGGASDTFINAAVWRNKVETGLTRPTWVGYETRRMMIPG